MLRTIIFFGLITAAFASETWTCRKCSFKFFCDDPQQLEMLQSDPSPGRACRIDYAQAKETDFKALREEVPKLLKIGTGREARPPQLDSFATAYAVAGEKQEMVADQEMLSIRTGSAPDLEASVANYAKYRSDSHEIFILLLTYKGTTAQTSTARF